MDFDTSKSAIRFLIIILILSGCNETGNTPQDAIGIARLPVPPTGN